jgi:uncharacterized membrane protein
VKYNDCMSASRSRWGNSSDLIFAVLALVVIAVLMFLAPHGLLDMADRAGYAVCHQIADHSITIAGHQLPLCARCTGMYLGALAGLMVLAGRGKGRAAGFPSRRYLMIFAVFMALWAFDGANSFLALLGLPHLYEPSNGLRLLTGVLQGVAIAAVLLPALNTALWAAPDPARSVENGKDLLWLLLGAGVVFVAVATGWDALLFPLALLSGAAVPFLLGALNAMLYLAVRHREGTATRWAQVVSPLLVGLALAFIEIALIGAGRDALTAAVGLPF